MARPIEEYETEVAAAGGSGRDGRTGRSTARAFAAAISAFAISALVITTSADALEPDGTVAGTSFAAGTIELNDDDGDAALFTLADMGPNDPREECIEVRYDGTIVPVDLSLHAETKGGLAPYLLLTVESGAGGAYGDCSRFEADETVFSGTLDEMVAAGPEVLDRLPNSGDARSFRFRLEMADEQGAVGQVATVEFAWVVTPA